MFRSEEEAYNFFNKYTKNRGFSIRRDLLKYTKGADATMRLRRYCWKYALEAIIKWLLLYFLNHDKVYCSCYNCIERKLKYMCEYISKYKPLLD